MALGYIETFDATLPHPARATSESEAPAKPSREEELLTEIRDLLKKS